MKRLFSCLLIIVVIFQFPGCKTEIGKTILQEEGNSLSILFKGVDVFNGKDQPLLFNQDVWVENGLIKKIKSNIDLGNNQAKVIEAQGKTLMPGLVDAHVHLSGSGSVPWDNISADKEYNLSAYLYAGITTVYDLGGLAGSLEKLANKVEKGELIGPNIYHTHIPITVKNSHPIPLTEEVLSWPLKTMVNRISPTIAEPNEAPKVIEKYLKLRVDYVKIACDQIPPGSPEMSFDLLKALVDEAHEQDKKVFVHIGSPENAVNAAQAGADVLAHGIWRGELSSEQADIIAAAKIPVIYTLAAFQNVDHINHGVYEPTEFDQKLVSPKILLPVTGEKGKDSHEQPVMHQFFEDVSSQKQYWKSNFELLSSRNVPILVGTDSNLPGTYAGSTYYQELDALKAYGLSNFEILKSATYRNSRIFLKNPDFGTVEVGMKADLLLLDGNPLEDLDFVKNPSLIVVRGQLVKRI